jgi:RNase H-fold protein (predicted Holliday junction resolvase)
LVGHRAKKAWSANRKPSTCISTPGARGARLKARLDSVAAQRILESFFAAAKKD